MLALVAILIIFFSVLPLPRISSKGFKFSKMEDGTYSITQYTGNASYVEIPETIRGVKVTKIAPEAFENKTCIKTVVIHNNIVEIGGGAFRGCTSLESLTVPFIGMSNDHNTHLDYIFSGNYGTNLTSNSVPRSLKKIYITKGCTKISTYAFYLCENLTEVHIPSTVTTI